MATNNSGFLEIFGNDSDNISTNQNRGFSYMSGGKGDDTYIIENLAKSWTTIDDRDYGENDPTSIDPHDSNDSLILKNLTSKDVVLFFDVYHPDREGLTSDSHPDDGLYVIKKNAINSVMKQV